MRGADCLYCPSGCEAPVRRGIARFVAKDPYAAGFGLQWKTFRRAQLDSCTGTTISRDRLTRLMGGRMELSGLRVLEAGCGAGRFTEILLEAGAGVMAVDLSSAVEANYENCGHYPDYFVCQADILRLPVRPEAFDVVVCIGVVQHTPDPEATMAALCSYVKPGGLLVMDHYTHGYAATPSRRLLRSFLLRAPAPFALEFCQCLVALLWPFHRFLARCGRRRPLRWLRRRFLAVSPVVDYHDAYGRLGPELLRVWAVLDTHDTLTDVYKHLRGPEEIAARLRACGMTDVETTRAGNGVEVRARKPAR